MAARNPAQVKPWTVSVPAWENVKKANKNDHTLFDIRINSNAQEWVIRKRFSDIYAFHQSLEGLFESDRLPEFPPRTLTSFGNFEAQFVEKRRGQLDDYFASLPAAVFTQPVSRHFFGADDASIEKQALAPKHEFRLPPMPADFPEMATLASGEEVFPSLLVISLADTLAEIQKLQDSLLLKNTLEARFDLLEASQDTIKRLTASLTEMQLQTQNLLSDRKLGGQALTYNHLSDCAEQILIAADWLSKTDDVALQGINTASLSINTDEKLAKYQTDAEELVTAAVQNTMAHEEVGAKLKELKKQLEYDKVVYKLRRQTEVVSRLDAVLGYLSASSGVVDAKKGVVKGTAVSIATVDDLETQLFGLISEVGHYEGLSAAITALPAPAAAVAAPVASTESLDSPPAYKEPQLVVPDVGDASPPPPYNLAVGVQQGYSEAQPSAPPEEAVSPAKFVEEIQRLHGKIEELAKNVALARSALEKQNDQANTLSLHRLGDMQENIADLEYRFSSKFQPILSSTTLHDMLKAKQVKEARRNHLIVESDLYGL